MVRCASMRHLCIDVSHSTDPLPLQGNAIGKGEYFVCYEVNAQVIVLYGAPKQGAITIPIYIFYKAEPPTRVSMRKFNDHAIWDDPILYQILMS